MVTKAKERGRKRLRTLKAGEVNVLVATDIAARGIDIDLLPQVVNFELPNVSEDYVHRIGRTGRAGASGKAISLVCADEIDLLNDVQHLIQMHIPREEIIGFEPVNPLPESRKLRPLKAKKPKKPKKPKQAQSEQAKQSTQSKNSSKVEHKDGQRSGDVARGHKPTGKNRRHKGGNNSVQNRSKPHGDNKPRANQKRRVNKPKTVAKTH